MNLTADLVADALFQLQILKDKVCRVYSSSRDDIFNIKINQLPEWSILHKMLFDVQELDDYTKKHTVFDEELITELPQEVIK